MEIWKWLLGVTQETFASASALRHEVQVKAPLPWLGTIALRRLVDLPLGRLIVDSTKHLLLEVIYVGPVSTSDSDVGQVGSRCSSRQLTGLFTFGRWDHLNSISKW